MFTPCGPSIPCHVFQGHTAASERLAKRMKELEEEAVTKAAVEAKRMELSGKVDKKIQRWAARKTLREMLISLPKIIRVRLALNCIGCCVVHFLWFPWLCCW